VIARLTAAYLAVFACVLALLSFVAYVFVSQQYHSLLLPALTTPEGQAAYAQAMRRVGLVIVGFDVPLLIAVGVASALLARISVAPLLLARDREQQFLADAAHGLRSPLATIASVAQAAQTDAAEERVRDSFSLISKTSVDASGLIADLLTLARDPDARLLQLEPVDLGALAKQCTREFEERARSRAMQFTVETDSAIVNGDERRLRELMRNLLDNAFRHARTSVALRVRVVDTSAELRVGDDGSGIPQSERAHIFERFASGSGHSEGTGLGLSISRWIAQAHGGTLAITDDSLPGATFVARIPLFSAD
jgi:signal transduction histidine kinase